MPASPQYPAPRSCRRILLVGEASATAGAVRPCHRGLRVGVPPTTRPSSRPSLAAPTPSAMSGDTDAAIATLTALAETERRPDDGPAGAWRPAAQRGALRGGDARPMTGRWRAVTEINAAALGHLLQPRHHARAQQAMGTGRGRFPQGAGAEPRPAAGAELPRLLAGRTGREAGRGAGDDRAGRRGRARQRLHHRQPRLGAVQAWPLRRGAGTDGEGVASGTGRSRS